ncbi:WD40-repeat-containing domain protein [Paraphysoderma sedebokerense]|nr:WD40-repeat-containing domain protein [Paraphysoderma sedebokerense]
MQKKKNMEKGKALMLSGEFGPIELISPRQHNLGLSRCPSSRSSLNGGQDTPKANGENWKELWLDGKKNIVSKLQGRELCGKTASSLLSFNQKYLPNHPGKKLLDYEARPYIGQFSSDGSLFYTCTQDFRVHVYECDTKNFRKTKTVTAQSTIPFISRCCIDRLIIYLIFKGGRWTITDAALTPDNSHIMYSSITPIVHLANLNSDSDEQHSFDFGADSEWDSFGIWSIRFSSDGKEIVAGTSNSRLYVYDIETRQVVLKLEGHDDDVNAVCFADPSSNVLYSGSDDTLVKVWDRRSMRPDRPRPSGILPGHTEGLTYVASKDDGRYCLTNSKDQSMKLWDIRRMMEPQKFDTLDVTDYRIDYWDYRHMPYPARKAQKHAHDCSLLTMSGHSVLVTLIRCHFSPAATTGCRYLYTGSADGRIHIYNLQGEVEQVLDTKAAMISSGINRGADEWGYYGSRTKFVVRDVSWHPQLPMILSTNWSGMQGGSVLKHEHCPVSDLPSI